MTCSDGVFVVKLLFLLIVLHYSSPSFVMFRPVSYKLLEEEVDKDTKAANQHSQNLSKMVVHIFCHSILSFAFDR